MDKENIPLQVFCRLSPCDQKSCIESVTDNAIKIRYEKGNTIKNYLYSFSRIFDQDCGQSTVFNETVSPLVSDLLLGNNSLVFTYGISGSGKTHTMFGSLKSPGIVIRSLDTLFNSLEYLLSPKYCIISDGSNGFNIQTEADALHMKQKLEYNENIRSNKYASRYGSRETDPTRHIVAKGYRYAIFASFYELYNNNFLDLLSPSAMSSRVKLNIREDMARNVYVSGLTEVEIRSTEEGMHLLEIGRKRRHVAGTNLNNESSRSHSIFCLKLVRVNADEKYDEILISNPDVKVSQLCLVDLAGSERTNRAQTKGDRLKEASSINNTLMTLRQCIDVLKHNQKGCRNSPPLSGSVTSLDSSGIHSLSSQTGKNYNSNNNNQKMVPYRDSKLTHIFKSFFEGDGAVRMIVCVKPLARETDELLHVFNFAEATQTVSTVRYIHETTPPDYKISSMDIPEQSVLLQSSKKNSVMKNLSEVVHKISSGFNRDDLHYKKLFEKINSLINSGSDFNRTVEKYTMDNVKFQNGVINRFVKEEEDSYDVDEEFDEGFQSDADYKQFVERNNKLINFFSAGGEDECHLNSLLEGVELLHDNYRVNLDRAYTEKFEKLVNKTKNNFVERNKIIDNTKNKLTDRGIVSSMSRQFESKLSTAKRPQIRTPVTPSTCDRNSRIQPKISYSSLAKKTPINSRYDKNTCETTKWLEHTESNATPLGTIMKPQLRRSRSTSRPGLRDTLKATNYLLHHQECTPTGELETRLYKGDIIPTAGGGASVIFNDVEELRQYSPLKNKSQMYTDQRYTRSSTQITEDKENQQMSYGKKRSSVVALGSENFNHELEEKFSKKPYFASRRSQSVLITSDEEYLEKFSSANQI